MVRYEDPVGRTFAALADPTRRQVLERLLRGPASVGELSTRHGVSVPGMLKHVRVLEDAGVVRTEKDGRVRRCGLTPTPLGAAARYLDRYRELWERRFDALEELVQRGRKS
jgi:DNA-binding transcriptional ArsR family regulator